MSKTVTFYFYQDLLRVPVIHAMDYLLHHKEFTCFIDYCNPVTGEYTADYAIFQPNTPHHDDDFPAGFFMTAHNGLTIKIPADMQWWAAQSEAGTLFSKVSQKAEVIIDGKIKAVEFDMGVGPIRIKGNRATPLEDALEGVSTAVAPRFTPSVIGYNLVLGLNNKRRVTMFYRPKGGGVATYIKSAEENRQTQDARYKTVSDTWHRKWITVWRLKRERLWTDGMITKLLGKPKAQGKYKVFPVQLVREAERLPDFQAWLAPRLVKATAKNQYFEIKLLPSA